MRRGKKFKYLTLALVLSFTVSMLAGCGNSSAAGEKAEVSGSIIAMGSSALQPLAEELSKKFTEKNPKASVQVQGGGSGNGLKAAFEGTAQIGNSDIFAEEKKGIDASVLEDHRVCVVGFATIVNPKVNVDNLTKQQLIDIFTGKIDNWSKVGGQDMKIVLISRPASSGTRATFKKYALDGTEEVQGKSLTEDSSGAVLKAIGDTEGAIGYISLAYVKNNSNVKPLKLDGAEASLQNIKEGKYSVWSYEHMYTKGPATGLAKNFIEYVMSDEAKSVIDKLGYIAVKDMKVSR